MPTFQIAKLVATLVLDDKGFKDKTEENKRSSTAFFDSLKKGAIVMGAVTAAFAAMKKAYDFGKEGAQLNMLENRFDRLSESIGTTSEALLVDLKKATGGLYSDSQLMQSATDFISLGLAKTSDEAVRLAKVSSGLNMNMNQLILTLTNMTTMRFDALGVKVDGFKEKVKNLEKAGMSADAAFKEAFLQQAEEQLTLVGNAADEDVAAFMRLEAQIKNTGDTIKKNFSRSFAPLLKHSMDLGDAMQHNRDVLWELNKPLYDTYMITNQLNPEMRQLVQEYDLWTARGEYLRGVLQAQNQEAETTTVVVKQTAEQIRAMSDENKNYSSVVLQVADANREYNEGLAEANRQLEAGEINADEYAKSVDALGKEYDKTLNQIVADLILINLTADGAFDDADLRIYLAALQELGIITAEDARAAQELYDSTMELESQLKNNERQAQLTKLKMDSLQWAMRNADDAARDAAGGFGALKSSLNGLPKSGTSWNYYITVHTKGGNVQLPATATYTTGGGYNTTVHPGGGGRASGGTVMAGQPYRVGEMGRPEWFVPQSNGRIETNNPNQPTVAKIDRRDMEMLADLIVEKALRAA